MPPDAEQHDSPPDASATEEHHSRVAKIFGAKYTRIVNSLCRWVSRQDAEDLASRAFGQLLECPNRSVIDMAAYVSRAARNLLANFCRDNNLHRDKLALLESEGAVNVETVPSAESVCAAEQTLDLLQKTVEEMDPLKREIFHLRRRGLSTVEIVADLVARGYEEISDRTVQRQIQQIRAACLQSIFVSVEPKMERKE